MGSSHTEAIIKLLHFGAHSPQILDDGSYSIRFLQAQLRGVADLDPAIDLGAKNSKYRHFIDESCDLFSVKFASSLGMASSSHFQRRRRLSAGFASIGFIDRYAYIPQNINNRGPCRICSDIGQFQRRAVQTGGGNDKKDRPRNVRRYAYFSCGQFGISRNGDDPAEL